MYRSWTERRAQVLKPLAIAMTATVSGSLAMAQDKPLATVTAISPIFGQLLMMAHPEGFKPAHERTQGDRYIQEVIPSNEQLDAWTQMITVTGAKGLANMQIQAYLTAAVINLKRLATAFFALFAAAIVASIEKLVESARRHHPKALHARTTT